MSFIHPTACPTIRRSFPALIVLTGTLLLSACASDGDNAASSNHTYNNTPAHGHFHGEDLNQSRWQLVSFPSYPDAADQQAYQKFFIAFHKKDGQQTIGGKAFNSFNATAKILDTGSLAVSDKMVSTRMAVANPQWSKMEHDFFTAIQGVMTWQIVDGQLILETPQGKLAFKSIH